MLLALDVGNSQIFGGVFKDDKIILRFRKTSKSGSSSDELGIFLRTVLRENAIDPTGVEAISLCTVVPDVLHSIKNACRKYFQISPFVLEPGVKTGLRICYHNPNEVGTDRIANALGAQALFGPKNFIIIDLGTATTFCAIQNGKDYLGGVIIAGIRLNMEALESQTAKLPAVEIVSLDKTLGRSTVQSIQSGLFWGHLGQMKEIVVRLKDECFPQTAVTLVGTGGFSSLYEKMNFFEYIEPDLVLHGLKVAHELNA